MIDLVCVNYNTAEEVARFISTLFKDVDGRPPFNLTVVDNGSTDESREVILALSEKHFFTSVLEENIGYSAASNRYGSRTGGDIVALLNADVWMTVDDVLSIEKAFEEDSRIAILGPKQRDERGSITHAGIFPPDTKPFMRGWHQPDPNDSLYRDLEGGQYSVMGSAYFIRRTVWNELWNCPVYREQFPEAEGPFLPTPHYYEETYCSVHARKHGYEIFYDGRTSIGHSWHKSSPVGGEADKKFRVSELIFKDACERHEIVHNIR